MFPWRHIMLATDLSPASEEAATEALDLASRLGAKLTVAHVYEMPSYPYTDLPFDATLLFEPVRKAAEDAFERQLLKIRARVPEATGVLRMGNPGEQLLRVIDQIHPDLVVLGTHGRHGVSHFFLGSVAEKVARQASVPVLIARATPSEGARDRPPAAEHQPTEVRS